MRIENCFLCKKKIKTGDECQYVTRRMEFNSFCFEGFLICNECKYEEPKNNSLVIATIEKKILKEII